MTLDELKASEDIVFECITGSRAYGLHTEHSDTDKKGVFIVPKKAFYSIDYLQEVSLKSNDEVYYELNKFIRLISKSNPSLLEMLAVPKRCLIQGNALIQSIDLNKVLSKECEHTFGGYALSQIRKARGIRKYINKPLSKTRKSILNFCYVITHGVSTPLLDYLQEKGFSQEKCGLRKIHNSVDLYAFFHSKKDEYEGVIRSVDSNEVCLSSVSENQKSEVYLFFNKKEYSSYCKEHNGYWEWMKVKNTSKFHVSISKGYNPKNMMHTFRLLAMAEEIAKGEGLIVDRPDKEFLLDIRSLKYEYSDLARMAEEKITSLSVLYQKSGLINNPEIDYLAEKLWEIRKSHYNLG